MAPLCSRVSYRYIESYSGDKNDPNVKNVTAKGTLLQISVSSTVSGAVKSVRFYTAPLEILIYIYYDKLPSIFQKP